MGGPRDRYRKQEKDYKRVVGKKKPKTWFKSAVENKPLYTLGGWSKSQPTKTRRKKALASRPKNWTLSRKYLSTSRALQSLCNINPDKETKRKAKADADYLMRLYHKTK